MHCRVTVRATPNTQRDISTTKCNMRKPINMFVVTRCEHANQHVWGHTTTSKCNANGHRKIEFEHGIQEHACAAPTHTKKSHIDTSINTLVVTTKYNVSKAMNMLVVTTNTNTITLINVLLSTTKSPHNMHCEHGLQPTCEFGVLSCVRTWHVVHLAWSRLFLFLCVVHYICTCNQCTTHTTKRYGTTYAHQANARHNQAIYRKLPSQISQFFQEVHPGVQ